MRERLLTAWARIISRYPGRVIIGAVCLTVLAGMAAGNLEIKTNFSDSLPENDPMAMEFQRILDEFTSSSNTMMVIKGPAESIKAFAEELAPRIEKIDASMWHRSESAAVAWARKKLKLEKKKPEAKPLVRRVDYKIDMDFIRQHALMLVKARDLENMEGMYKDLGLVPFLTAINDNFEKTYVFDEDSLSNKTKENEAVAFLDGLATWLAALDTAARGELDDETIRRAVDRLLLGEPYLMSFDKRMLLMIIEPAFSMEDVDACIASTEVIQAMIDEAEKRYAGVAAGLTGMIPLGRDEMVFVTADMKFTSTLGLALVFALFVLSFRMWAAPLLAALNLVMGIVLTSGLIALTLGYLDLGTSMFAVILLGLGIDFSVHIISLYNEFRGKGATIEKAVTKSLHCAGAGVITGGLTTACAFLTLMVASTRNMRGMGLVMGMGVLCCMLVSILVLPAFLVWRERLMARRNKDYKKPSIVEFAFLAKAGEGISRRPVLYLVIAAALTGLLGYQASRAKFDYNYLNMEPKGLESISLQHDIIDAFDLSPDFAMVTATDIEEARRISEAAKDLPTVSMVDSITYYVPSVAEQAKRRPLVERIGSYLRAGGKPPALREAHLAPLLEQLQRFEDNIYEMGQMAYTGGQDKVDAKCQEIIGDPEDNKSVGQVAALIALIVKDKPGAAQGLSAFQERYVPVMRRAALKMANPAEIRLADLPGRIKRQFFNERGDQMLITIYPKENVWNVEFLKRFSEQLERVDEKITGLPPMFLTLMELMFEDGRKATSLTLVVVFLLLWFDFRSARFALMAMLPLVVGAIWMIGIMKSVGMMMTFVNIMGIPMIVGIGIDDGVHLLHRYRVEGKGKIKMVVGSTGRAIMLTTVTTMACFGVLLLAKYRGLGSLGGLLALGVGACFLTTMLILPALLGLWERRK